MRLLDMFEVTVDDGRRERVLVVVASDEREARRLAGSRGLIKGIAAVRGPFAVRGGSRVVGAIVAGAAC